MYEYGFVEKDPIQAVRYLELAFAQGHVLAALELSNLYQQPEILGYQIACDRCRFAAENGSAEAEFAYASFLLFGRGCPADPTTALRYYKRALGHGVVQAGFMIDKLAEYFD